jgi:nucleoside-diphosphate-sugar epimerase
MKILVIGSGFVAVPIVKKLESEGHEVLVYSRTATKKLNCQQIEGDIFNFTDFVKVLSWEPNIVIHTAWITTPGIYKSDPSNFEYAKFTVNLANYIKYSEIEHLIILGTCAEYGQQTGPSTAGFTKTSPNIFYSEQKVAAFKAVEEVMQETAIRFTWARLFFPYGPNQHEKRLIPHLIDSLNHQASIRLADVSSVYDWITTRDIASAVSWVIQNKLPVEIDIGTSIGATNLELLTILEGLLQTKHKVSSSQGHEIGAGEFFVMGKDSPLLGSGWLPKDTLQSGLKWTLEE